MDNEKNFSSQKSADIEASGIVREAPTRRTGVQSLTRLVVGGLGLGADEFIRRLRLWEIAAEKEISSQRDQFNSSAGGEDSNASELARYALIGLLFEFQDGLGKSMGFLGRIQKLAANLLSPFLRPIRSFPLLSPTQKQMDRLISRGQHEVNRWINRGRQEEMHGRQLASIAMDDVIEEYIEYLAENPEVQELVQTQSTGLANEVVEEVRERTVSADTFLEGVARSLLRMTPRTRLPEPSEKLRQSAESLRPPKKRRRTPSAPRR